MPTTVPSVPRETGIYLFLSRLPNWVLWLVLPVASWGVILGAVVIVWSIAAHAGPALHVEGYDLPPYSYTVFCVRYPAECKPEPEQSTAQVALTPERRAQLVKVNAEVNAAISRMRKPPGYEGLGWQVWPTAGDCNDYAVTKRHELLQRGWPVRAARLAVVIVPSGEYHLVLVVSTNEGDLVLDNLRGNITPWDRLPYKWVRIQSQSPKYDPLWQKISSWLRDSPGAFFIFEAAFSCAVIIESAASDNQASSTPTNDNQTASSSTATTTSQ